MALIFSDFEVGRNGEKKRRRDQSQKGNIEG